MYRITKPDRKLVGEVTLEGSKSISNRVLIINALNYSGEPIKNLSDCEDTRILKSILYSNTNVFDVGDAGTSMRFLTAYLAKVVGEWTVLGSDRMKKRPIGVLVDALNELGAQISYLEEEGYPPLKILGSNLTGEQITLDGSISSQFISALLLISPTLKNGLVIKLKGQVVSRSYIEMTLKIMEDFGVKTVFKKDEIRVLPQSYKPIPYKVEGDWTGASYWYSLMALADEGRLKLNGLKRYSYQGDSRLVSLFEKLGVKTIFSKKGTHIEKCPVSITRMEEDFTNIPDLVQTFAVCCVLKNIPFCFKGVDNLSIKECDRIQALITELGRLGFVLSNPESGTLVWDGERKDTEQEVIIKTYNDHRMAMAFIPVAFLYSDVVIDTPKVVRKSYPQFWKHLEDVGFSIKEELAE